MLAAAPDNQVVAAQVLGHAVTAGDWPLALRAAHLLERRNALLPDARFLLIAEAFRNRDWREARRQIDLAERERLFAFAVPLMRAWLAVGARSGDPLSFLPGADETNAAAAYAAEHRPLLLVAMGRAEGVTRMREMGIALSPRVPRLRIAAAAALARRGDRPAALSLLEGDEPSMAAARALVEAGRPVPGAIDSASAGLAEFLLKLGLDLHAQDLTPVAATFARLASWLAPDNSETWLVTAELLARMGRHADGVALLANVRPDDPFVETMREQRLRLLVDGSSAEALAEAERAARGAEATAADQVRFGEVLTTLNRPAEAARAYARALELRSDSAYPEWGLWLLRGGAHDAADEWPEARAALERAYSLAPEQPLVLNYLGYAQLARRENMIEAERLIREAHRLAPDNAAITDSLGWALFLKGDHDGAIPLLEQAVQGAPADVEINEHLGDAYFAAGRRVEARFAWAAARVYAESEDSARLAAKIESGLTPALAAR